MTKPQHDETEAIRRTTRRRDHLAHGFTHRHDNTPVRAAIAAINVEVHTPRRHPPRPPAVHFILTLTLTLQRREPRRYQPFAHNPREVRARGEFLSDVTPLIEAHGVEPREITLERKQPVELPRTLRHTVPVPPRTIRRFPLAFKLLLQL